MSRLSAAESDFSTFKHRKEAEKSFCCHFSLRHPAERNETRQMTVKISDSKRMGGLASFFSSVRFAKKAETLPGTLETSIKAGESEHQQKKRLYDASGVVKLNNSKALRATRSRVNHPKPLTFSVSDRCEIANDTTTIRVYLPGRDLKGFNCHPRDERKNPSHDYKCIGSGAAVEGENNFREEPSAWRLWRRRLHETFTASHALVRRLLNEILIAWIIKTCEEHQNDSGRCNREAR